MSFVSSFLIKLVHAPDALGHGVSQVFVRDPVGAFFQQRLKVNFDNDELTSRDDETFQLDGLENWQHQDRLSQALKRWVEEDYQP